MSLKSSFMLYEVVDEKNELRPLEYLDKLCVDKVNLSPKEFNVYSD